MAKHDQQFDTFMEWTNHASSWLTHHPDYNEQNFRAICFDTRGQHCKMGRDFEIARDRCTFPVRWLWPDEIGPIVLGLFKGDETNIHTESDLLLSCPFCVGAAHTTQKSSVEYGIRHRVECLRRISTCPMDMRTKNYFSEEEALAAWNTRN